MECSNLLMESIRVFLSQMTNIGKALFRCTQFSIIQKNQFILNYPNCKTPSNGVNFVKNRETQTLQKEKKREKRRVLIVFQWSIQTCVLLATPKIKQYQTRKAHIGSFFINYVPIKCHSFVYVFFLQNYRYLLSMQTYKIYFALYNLC